MAEDQKRRTLVLQGDKSTWVTPSCLPELLQLKSLYPLAPLVVGNTLIGPQIEMVGSFYPVIISPARVPELSIVNYAAKGITIGAACSLTLVKSILSEAVSQLPEDKNKIFRVLLQQLNREQMRNEASIGGSILSGSAAWELNPILAAGNCTFNLASKDRRRQVTLRQLLFDENGMGGLSPEEILISINVPFSRKSEFVSAFRQVQRWGTSGPSIVAAMKAVLKEGTDLILAFSIYYGGSESACVFAKTASEQLAGRRWDDAMLDEACRFFLEEDSVLDLATAGMADFEKTLAISFLFKFYLQVAQELKQTVNFLQNSTPENQNTKYYAQNNKSLKDQTQMIANGFHMSQDEVQRHLHESMNGHGTVQQSRVLQTIEEEEIEDGDDDTPMEGELFLALVTSNRHHAKIISIHKEDALKARGVVDVITAADVPGINDINMFANDKVQYVGQVVCAVVADTQTHADQGASRIRIYYEDLEPVLLSIQDAIKNDSFFAPVRTLEHGNVDEAFKSVDHILEGEEYIGGSDDHRIGSQTLRVIPRGEDNEMEVILSTRDPLSVQATVASAINVPSDFVMCNMECGDSSEVESPYTASLAAIGAVAALKTGHLVHSVLKQREDSSMSKHLPRFLGKYKVGCMNDGRILALDVTYYCNAGCISDHSLKVLAMSLLSSQNAYSIPNARCSVIACRTNLPPKILSHGYCFPLSGMLAELWVDAVAGRCGLSPEKVRHMHLHKQTSQTSFKPHINATNLLKCWDECVKKSSLPARTTEAKESNQVCPWLKKGFSIIPVMFPVGFIADFLNQAYVLVHIYKDGWVLITPAGNELGEETRTKMMQVASQELRIPLSYIQISETSTTIASDTSVTATSFGATAHALAVQNACQILLHRLQAIINLNPDATWRDCVQDAYRHRVCLSATGYYRSPDAVLDWDLDTGTESPEFVFGTACSEVELNCRTGEHKNVRTDIVLDVGSNISQTVNTEQIKEAFREGLELFTREDFKYFFQESHNGIQSSQTESEKSDNTPEIFNVTLLPSSPNPYMICSPKAVQEVSMFLASSVFFAIKDAILAARHHTGLPGSILLPVPVRPQHVLIACGSYMTDTARSATPKEDSVDNHISET
ncbi:aldehyde oxidase-like [Pelobates cultripes]|uniref:Aldehyde oxidase-like n=2 Tax=Pelobates cultripes TaxID=61616 RepID=A0AAD1SNR6_PELCU|nr:aldehyde oxidase-like [Pelobates cultripes]